MCMISNVRTANTIPLTLIAILVILYIRTAQLAHIPRPRVKLLD